MAETVQSGGCDKHDGAWSEICPLCEIEHLKHDLDRYMTIATNEFNRSERLRVPLRKVLGYMKNCDDLPSMAEIEAALNR